MRFYKRLYVGSSVKKKRRQIVWKLKNGKVTPVTGIRPTTTSKFKRVCKISSRIKPKAKYFPNKSLVSKEILTTL